MRASTVLISEAALAASMLVGVGVLTLATRAHSCHPDEYADLRGLDPRLASSDAVGAALRNDLRLITVNGYTEEAPGIQGDWTALAHRFGSRNLAGTSDAIRCQEQGRLDAAARQYAAAYNRQLVFQIRTSVESEREPQTSAAGGDQAR